MLIRALVLLIALAVPLQATAAGYVVHPGDTLSLIARRYHVALASLARINHLSSINFIQAGKVLLIPVRTHSFYYRVRWGDTLIGIGWQHGMTVASIRGLNPSLGVFPIAGQWLKLCGPCSSVSGYSGTATNGLGTSTGSNGAGFYVVHSGDTLGAIAAHYGLSQAALAAANRMNNPNIVPLGSRLVIPSGAVASAATYNPWGTRALITSYAQRYGLNPSLPLAVGWQESGFNQNALSRTGAIGVMQVEPYTGTHISSLLGRRMNLLSREDNVHAGVYWLSHLVSYYGGNERMAVAAYYQGSKSLVRHGFYQDTVQYVNNVMSLKTSFGG